MGLIDGDIVPSASGTSHLGVEARGASNFSIDSLAPFGHIHQLSGVFHNENGTSGVIRFGISAFEFSTDGGITFSSPAAVGGDNRDVLFNNNGAIAGDSLGLTFDATPNILGVSGAIQVAKTDLVRENFTSPGSGIVELRAINLAERPMFGASTSGQQLPYFFQPSLFSRFIFMAYTSNSTTISSYGNSLTSNGTVSHPAATSASGFMVNIVSAATANSTASTGSNTTQFVRGASSGMNTGFFYATRITLPDANLDAGRVFVGLVNGTMVSSVAADDPGNNHCGFSFSTIQANPKNWFFSTRNTTARSTQDTGISCSGNRIWDMYLYCPPAPNNEVIYWTLRDVSWNRLSNGYAINRLPNKGSLMRAGVALNNITASARNIRFTHIYCESIPSF